MILRPTTPVAISKDIVAFCQSVASNERPRYLKVEPAAGAQPNDCVNVVASQIARRGGAAVTGWQIWEWPKVLVEAEFHVVWEAPDGVLHDVTPKPTPYHITRIVFLPDPGLVYEGKQINNRRKALSPTRDVEDFIAAAEEEFEIINRGERAYQHGRIDLVDDESIEYREIQRRKLDAELRIRQRLAADPSRNGPCPCGSGRKFKRCHGPR
jgi:hypothetical protein